MTLEEAEQVARVIATADDGCAVCVKDLVLHLRRVFPGFLWEYVNGQVIVASTDAATVTHIAETVLAVELHEPSPFEFCEICRSTRGWVPVKNQHSGLERCSCFVTYHQRIADSSLKS